MGPENFKLECRRGPDQWKATSKTSIMRDVNELCVVGDPKHVQKLYARKSGDPTVYSEKEFKKKLKEENPFIKEILYKKKIWIIGGEHEFTKMGNEDRTFLLERFDSVKKYFNKQSF